MASRVNVKFVVLLSAALGLTFLGVAGALVFVKMRSGDRYATLAKQAADKGDFETADKFYARAVGKEHGNVAWLKAWRDVREKMVPPSESAFTDAYHMYFSILSTLGTVERTPESFRAPVDLQFRALIYGAPREQWDQFATFVEDYALRNFSAESAPPMLRRYRGIAIVLAMLQVGKDEIKPDRQKLGRDDLEAAFKADPKDYLAGNYLSIWHRAGWRKALLDHNQATADTEREASQKVDADLLAADPDVPYVLVETFDRKVRDQLIPADASKMGSAETIRAQQTTIASLRPQVDALSQQLLGADPARLDVFALGDFESLALNLGGKDGEAMFDAVLEKALAASPNNAELLSLKATSLLQRGEYEKSIAAFQKVIDLPNPTVGLDGLHLWIFRKSSVFQQADAAARLIGESKDQTARTAAVARATTYRQEVAKRYPANAPELKFVDGEIAFYRGDTQVAQTELSDFLRAPGEARGNVEHAKELMVDVGVRTNQLGLARQNLLELKQIRDNSQRSSLPILLALAQIEMQLEHAGTAADYCRQALAQDPDNADAKKLLSVAQAVTSKDAKVDDPVLQRVADAARASRGDADTPGDDQKAIKILRDGLESSNYDPRIVGPLIQYQLVAGDRDGATATVQAALTKRPEDAGLKDALERLQASQTLEGTLKLIDSLGAPDLQKWLQRCVAYTQFNKPEEAKKALEEAAKMAPADTRVLEFQFVAALQAQDLAGASQVVDRATQADADHAGGNIFKARLLLAQGNLRDAIATFQKVVDRGSASPLVWRMLGSAQLQAGRALEGIDSLRKALELSPNDLPTVKLLVGSLAQLGRTQEALDAARAAESAGRRDPDFMNMWLGLEATSGNKQLARDRREAILTQAPGDNNNRAALAELYIDEHAWDKARTLLDALKTAAPTSTQVAALDARWHVERGDLAGARRCFEENIKAVQASLAGKPMPVNPYVAYAEFLLRYSNEPAEALTQLREAEKYQDPKTMPVTAMLADTEFGMAMYAQVEADIQRMIAGGVPDPKGQIRRRLVDTLTIQMKYAEAAKVLDGFGDQASTDVELVAQRAEVARGLGDRAKALDLLNGAVARFPDDPLPYYRRARLLMSDPSMTQDAMADLATAIKLRPGLWQPLRTRYSLLLQQGKTAEAMRDLHAAVDANPSKSDLRLELIDALLAAKQNDEAAAVADGALKGRSGDTRFLLTLAEHFNRGGDFQHAARYSKQVFDLAREPSVGVFYASALLAQTPPALAEAEAALSTPGLSIERSWSLLMARSLLRMKQGNEEAARSDLANALGIVRGVPELMRWYDRFRLVYPDPVRAAEILGTQRAQPPVSTILRFFTARCLLESPGHKAEGVKALQDIAGETGLDTNLRVQVYQALCSAQADQPEAAIQACKDGLALAPDDVMLNNNLAALSCENLGKAQEALPFAQKALAGAPQSPQVMDTMAKVQWSLGQKDQAIQTETEALRLPQNETDKVPLALQISRWKLASGDRAGAMAVADLAVGLICDNPAVFQTYKQQLDALNKDLRSAPH